MGLIGAPLKKRLDSLGFECVEAVDIRHENSQKVDSMIDWKIKADVVFHLADNCKINECIRNPKLSFENIRNIQAVLEMCRLNDIKKIVYFSSSRILSKEKNPYTAGKIYGEELVKTYSKCYGIDYIIIRPSTVYGGRDETSRVFSIWITQAKLGRDLEIFGDLNKTLSFTYIDDFIDGVIKSLEKWNGEYNIAGEEVCVVEMAAEIIKQMKSDSSIVFRPAEIQQPQRVNLKSDFPCNTTYKEGIRKCL